MTDNTLIDALQRPDAYPHPVDTPIGMHETHISWVLMTGTYAYKVKKPVRLAFLDFSSLAKRKQFCHEELQLNRRTAPDLYLSVVPITGTPEAPEIDGSGDPIDYAVRMRQFDDADRLDKVLAAGKLDLEELARFGTRLADFHESAAAAESADRGRATAVGERMRRNLEELDALCTPAETASLRQIADWTETTLGALTGLLDRRAATGRTREGHGDLHLRNLVRLEGEIQAFDCIEFDAALRWIDVIDDLAFAVMDLELNDAAPAATVLLDAYLRASGDYEGLAVLDLYVVYRALVRAKVAAIERNDAGDAGSGPSARIEALLALALQRAERVRPGSIILMHGLPASGKSSVAERLVAALPAIRISSDVERKRLAGLDRADRSGSPIGAGLYSAERNEATYERLAALARSIVDAHRHAIVDATFLKRAARDDFYDVARRSGSPVCIVHCAAPDDVLNQRVVERAKGPSDSEADLEVLDHARMEREAVSGQEPARVVEVDTSTDYRPDEIAAALLADR